VELREEVVGLGNWGRTLTVLTADDLPDLDVEREDEEIVESWKPRFRR
jgi:glycerol-3-phosphate dehydrogenase